MTKASLKSVEILEKMDKRIERMSEQIEKLDKLVDSHEEILAKLKNKLQVF